MAQSEAGRSLAERGGGILVLIIVTLDRTVSDACAVAVGAP